MKSSESKPEPERSIYNVVIADLGYTALEEPFVSVDNPLATVMIKGLGNARTLRKGLVPREELLFIPIEWIDQDSKE